MGALGRDVIMNAQPNGKRPGRKIIMIDAMVVVQKLNPLPPSVKCCEDMSELFLRKQKDIASFDFEEIHIISGCIIP